MTNLLISNWKMNLNYDEYIKYMETLYSHIHYSNLTKSNNLKLILLPSSVFLYDLQSIVKKYLLKEVCIGAQEFSEHSKGSYTGQISSEMLSSIGIKYALLNHCEVKKARKTSDKYILNLLENCFVNQITPILCLSDEDLVLLDQLKNYIKDKTIVVYEPSWAIGNDNIVNKEKIYNKIKFIRQQLNSNIPILYGGSIKTQALSEFDLSLIDGLLIGRASLDPLSFLELSRKYVELKKL